MRPKGYILFIYYNRCEGFSYGIEISEYYSSYKAMMKGYHNHWDDKWDVKHRNRIHYFYLDLGCNIYTPLPRWKKCYNPKLGFDQNQETILSDKLFN